jgi:hypothetical protein
MFPNVSKSTLLAAALAAPVAVAVAAAPFPRTVEPEVVMPGDDLSLTETYCDLRETVVGTLRHDFAEAPQLAAVTGAGMTMELWASDLLGTWTVVHHAGDGISCIVTSGQDWTVGTDAVVLMDDVLAREVHQS